jgi:hypothetical protein
MTCVLDVLPESTSMEFTCPTTDPWCGKGCSAFYQVPRVALKSQEEWRTGSFSVSYRMRAHLSEKRPKVTEAPPQQLAPRSVRAGRYVQRALRPWRARNRGSIYPRLEPLVKLDLQRKGKDCVCARGAMKKREGSLIARGENRTYNVGMVQVLEDPRLSPHDFLIFLYFLRNCLVL